ncbi:class I SAM-dependent methyltransferase [Streptomyces sp. NPDC000410]|uniref:class I SAM-dependent methyltransferase n=1 Tax=Streptomyces sp. NPDC000410 TaxID=3154254 RepID=UPI00332DD6A0
MTSLPHRFLRALDQFNAAHPWDHNAHYHRWIMRQLPQRFDSALDIGSGSGDLVRLLATRGNEVQGIDSDPVIISQAQRLTPPATPATFTVADGLTGIGLSRAQTAADHLLGATAVPLNAATGWLKNNGRRAPRPTSMTALTRPADMSFSDIVSEAQGALPGARLRRRLFWRYTLVWHRH